MITNTKQKSNSFVHKNSIMNLYPELGLFVRKSTVLKTILYFSMNTCRVYGF